MTARLGWPPCASIIPSSIFVGAIDAATVIGPHEVVVRIERVVPVDAVADFKVSRWRATAIDQVMRVTRPGRVAGTHAGDEDLLARIGYQGHFAGKHVDELVFERMSVAQFRLGCGTSRHQI